MHLDDLRRHRILDRDATHVVAGLDVTYVAGVDQIKGASFRSYHPRVPQAAQRQALAVTLIGLGAVVAATLAISPRYGEIYNTPELREIQVVDSTDYDECLACQ